MTPEDAVVFFTTIRVVIGLVILVVGAAIALHYERNEENAEVMLGLLMAFVGLVLMVSPWLESSGP